MVTIVNSQPVGHDTATQEATQHSHLGNNQLIYYFRFKAEYWRKLSKDGISLILEKMGCNQSSENQWAYANENAPIKNVSKAFFLLLEVDLKLKYYRI